VVESEGERGEGLSSAGRHRQREEARRLVSLRTNAGENLAAEPVDQPLSAHRGEMPVEPTLQLGQDLLECRRRACRGSSAVEGFRVSEVRIDKTGEDHPTKEGEAEPERVEVRQAPVERRHQMFGGQVDFAFPYRVERCLVVRGQSCIERSVAAYPVRETSMMTSDCMSDELGDVTVVRPSRRC